MDPEAIARIDATLLPQMDRHHLRLLAHCLDSFQDMDQGQEGQLPDATGMVTPAFTMGLLHGSTCCLKLQIRKPGRFVTSFFLHV